MNSVNKTRKLVGTAMLSAVGAILMYIGIKLPFMPSFITLDMADLPALIGSFAYGPARGAVICVLKNLLHLLIQGSQTGGVGEISNALLGIFFVVPADVGLDEVDEAATLITSTANEEANIIWGARFDPNMTDEFKVTVVATGFENAKKNKKDDDFSRAAKADLIGDKNGNWFDDEDFDVINWSSKTTHINDDESEKYLESIKAVLRGNSGK